MSLHPIDGRKSRRSTGLRLQRSRRVGYHATSREWRPTNYYLRSGFATWKFPRSRDAILGLFGKKLFVFLLIGLATAGILGGAYADPQNPLFHHYITIGQSSFPGSLHDAATPFTVLWSDTGGSADTSGWNLSPGQRQSYVANYDGLGNNTYSLDAFAGNSSVMITKNPITNLAEAQGKILTFFFETDIGGSGWTASSNNDWGFFLTTNNTAPAHAQGSTGQWLPQTDPSVIFLSKRFCATSANPCGGTGSTMYESLDLALKKLGVSGETLDSENVGGCGSGSSCIDVMANSFARPGPTVEDSFLNFTGTAPAASVSACTVVNGGTVNVAVVGNGCSFTAMVPDKGVNVFSGQVGFTTTNNWLSLTHGNLYLGIYSKVPGFAVRFLVDTNGAHLVSQMNISAVVPGGQTSQQAPVSIDTGGYFGPIIQALLNIGIWMLNGILSFVSLIIPALEIALSVLEGAVKAALNLIGGAFGFVGTSVNCGVAGGQCAMGDLVFLLVTQLISFVTGTINTLLAQLGPLFTGLSNAFGVFVNWIAEAFTFLTDLLSFASGIAVFAFGMFTLGTKFGSFGIGLWLFIFFFAFNADDGMRGWIRWFNFSKWLIFDIGVNWTMQGINFLIDVMLFFIGLIPKPFIQMSVGKVPRLPLLEIHGSFDIPDFSGQALREGNLFSIIGFLGGFTGLVFFETTSLPGAFGSLPGTVFNAQALANMSVAVTFYKLFFPLVILMVFMLMIPTVFSSIFGYRVVGTGIPVSVSRGRGSVGPGAPPSRLGFSKRTTRISRHLETKGKRVSGEEAARKAAESLRNRNEEARRVAENEKVEIERLKREAQAKQRQEREAVETSLGDT